MSIGDKIRLARQEKGLTQQDLAETSGVCQQMISKLEVGKAQGTADIVKLAYALDVSPAWLEGLSKNKIEQKPQGKQQTKTEGESLNRKAVQACIEYLTEDPAAIFTRTSFRRQAEIFSLCYELCTQAKHKKLGKSELVKLLSRRAKRL